MRRLPLDDDGETPHALSGRLELPGQAERGFHNERPLHDAGQPADVPGGTGAPHLLVRVDEDHGGHGRLQTQRRYRPEREDHLHEPGLHVVDAGPPHDPAFRPDRHLLRGPERPDGVAVAEQELRPSSTALPGPRVEMVPDATDGVATARQRRPEEVKDPALAVRLGRGRFFKGQAFQKGDHLPPALAQVTEQFVWHLLHRVSTTPLPHEVGREGEREAFLDGGVATRAQVSQER